MHYFDPHYPYSRAKALEFLLPLQQSHPDNVDALVNTGIAHLRLGQLEQAHDALAHAERLDETRFETLVTLLRTRWEPQLGLAGVNLSLGRLDEAEAAVYTGLELAPNQPRLLALAKRLAELRNRPAGNGG